MSKLIRVQLRWVNRYNTDEVYYAIEPSILISLRFTRTQESKLKRERKSTLRAIGQEIK